ncbi:MAG: O-antigen ligase family protein [Patescibacteria group bacterium]
MNLSLKNKKIYLYLGIFALIELISYFAWQIPVLNLSAFCLIIAGAVILSIYRLEYGLLLILAELFIGSMGHLFVYSSGAFSISIRMALWALVLLIFTFKFITQLIKRGKNSPYLKSLMSFYGAKHFLLLAIFVLVGIANAYFRGHSLNLIFSDVNSWLYWLLILPLAVIYHPDNKRTWQNLIDLFLSAVIWLSLKTLFLLFVFTHNLSAAPEIYLWLRRSLVGEMTPTASGWPRVFIQGQIFSGIALFMLFWMNVKNTAAKIFYKPLPLILGALFASALLISFSRSFWVALVVTSIFSLLLVWREKNLRQAFKSALWLSLSFLLGLAIIYLVAVFPFPPTGKFNADFLNRVTNSNEAALSSRWSLLPVLVKEINKEPFLGQGFGATITYISSDPRVLQNNPSGEYTTYAFEWGYLDLLLKIGLLGTLAYLLLIFFIFKNALVYGHKNAGYLLLGLSSGLIFLAVTHVFTPYLNHPLGIGILLLGACLIQKDKVY